MPRASALAPQAVSVVGSLFINRVHRVDKIQLSHTLLPENTTVTIWTEMQVKISSTNLVSNMNSYASTPQRKTEALTENIEENHLDPQVQISYPNLVSEHKLFFSIAIAL